MTTARADKQPVLKLSRVIAASRQRVFDAWTDPAAIKVWWGRPDGVAVSNVEIDLRVGGAYRIVTEIEGGYEFPLVGRFLEVEPPDRLVYSFKWEREIPLPGGDFVDETRVTVEFRDLGDETEIVLTHEGFPNDEVFEFHNFGWTLSYDRLEVLLAGTSR
jgi:uncharacterized protein YndB with AHSA1/START domain